MAITKNSQIDLNGNEMILDADGDTSITADTDDQIDFKVGGTDRLSLESDGKLKVTEIAHITSGNLEIGNGDEKQIFDATGQTIQFQTADTERVRINATGLGIGDNNPSTKLSVLDSSTVYSRVKCSSSSNAAVLEILSSSGEGMDFIAYGDAASGTVFGGLHDRQSGNLGRNVVDVKNRDTIIGTSSHRFIEFVTSDIGRLRVSASGSAAGAMHYTSDYGRIDIGALNTGFHHFMAQTGPSTIYFNVACQANGGFSTYSDEKLKEDITTLTGALDSVAKMKGVTFKWKDAANRGGGNAGKQFGVTAQNMLEVDAELPTLEVDPLYNVTDKDENYVIDGVKEDDKYYTMDYARLTPYFIEAIKELKTKLEAAEARIATLEGS